MRRYASTLSYKVRCTHRLPVSKEQFIEMAHRHKGNKTEIMKEIDCSFIVISQILKKYDIKLKTFISNFERAKIDSQYAKEVFVQFNYEIYDVAEYLEISLMSSLKLFKKYDTEFLCGITYDEMMRDHIELDWNSLAVRRKHNWTGAQYTFRCKHLSFDQAVLKVKYKITNDH